jgi:hypothetical protein
LYFNRKLIFENNKTEKNFPQNVFYTINNSNNNVKNGNNLLLKMIKENKLMILSCFQFIKRSFLTINNIKFIKGIKYDDIFFSFDLISKINRTLETNQIFYFKYFHEKSLKKTDKLIKKLNDYIISIKELFLELLKKKDIFVEKFEIYIDNIEEIIIFIFNKIKFNKIFLINEFLKIDKILLFLILNRNNNLRYIENLYKNNDKYFFYYSLLFNNFKKNNCIKLVYKIEEFKKILFFEKKIKNIN